MIFTNSSGNMQPYISWKGNNNISTEKIPVNARPQTNVDNITYVKSGNAINPIKHWRKQLIPVNNTHSTDCSYNKYTYVQYDNYVNNSSKITKYGQPACSSNDPKSKIIKSAQMLTSSNYCRDSKEYLRKKCLTYEQRLTGALDPTISYVTSNGNPIYPSDSNKGTQIRNILNCTDNKCNNMIYKPNNTTFGTQGAVSSSSRIQRLKVDTINSNANSFRSAWGQEGANAGKYHGTTDTPYFAKNKNNNCNECIATISNSKPRTKWIR